MRWGQRVSDSAARTRRPPAWWSSSADRLIPNPNRMWVPACICLSVCLTSRLRCRHRPRGERAAHRLARGAGRGLGPHAEGRGAHAALAAYRPAWRLAQPDLPPRARGGCARARRVVGIGRGGEKARGPHGRTLPCRAGGVDAFIVCINLVPAIASRPSPSVLSHQHLHLHMMCLNVHRCALCARPRAGGARCVAPTPGHVAHRPHACMHTPCMMKHLSLAFHRATFYFGQLFIYKL